MDNLKDLIIMVSGLLIGILIDKIILIMLGMK